MARILVVEDEAVVLVLVEGILKDAGHETLTATDVAEARALLDSEALFDLLLTDIQLRGRDHGGLELAQEQIQRQPGLRVVYATGAAVTDGMRALFVEGSDVLAKPYTPKDVLDAVGRALGSPAS
jgi:CheY-like chemotaxis protein